MFLAVLGHDVRSPLSGIRMATRSLSCRLAETVRLQVAMRIRRAADVISRLTTDLLEYTRNDTSARPCVAKAHIEVAADRANSGRFSRSTGSMGAGCPTCRRSSSTHAAAAVSSANEANVRRRVARPKARTSAE